MRIAFIHYDNGNYSFAYEHMTALEKKVNIEQLAIYRSVALMSLENFKDAISILEKTSIQEDPWKSYVNWYLALCHLSINESEKAVESLQYLLESETTPKTYRGKARSLLNEL